MYIDWLLTNKNYIINKLKKAKGIMLLAFSLCIIPIISSSQNLVPNPSFETYTSCPTAFGQLSKAIPWYGTNNNSELFSPCVGSTANAPNTGYGFQPARTGNAYAGQYFMNGYGSDYREYIQVGLTNTLVTGNCYFVKFYVNCVNMVINYACNNFAAHISTGGYSTNFTGFPATSFTPQIYLVNNPIVKDTLKWIEIGGIYTAAGGENYITIGNFKNDVNTDTVRTNNGTINAAYYFIDDVSVEQITTPLWQLKDTMIIGGDSILIGPLYSGLNCTWFNMIGNPIGTGSGMWVKPTTTTSYILQQTFCNTTYSDTVTVYVSALGINDHNQFKNSINLYPQPAKDLVNISFNYFFESSIEIKIIDLNGRLLRNENLAVRNSKTNLQTDDLSNGIYFITISNQNHERITKKLVITR